MKYHFTSDRIRSVQFSCAVMSNSLTPHGLQHARLHQLPDLAQTHVHRVVMTSNHLILCCSLLLLPSVIPCIVVFSSGSVLPLRWPKYWSFSFKISSSNEYSGLISFRMDCLDLLVVQGTLKSLLQHQKHQFFCAQVSS